MRAAKEILLDQDLPMHRWVEEAIATMYVQNHTPHRVLENKTLKEELSGEKPEFVHFRIFGFPMYEKDQA